MGSYSGIMPLLSTIAALVIIVHSAEDDVHRERDHRYDLRTRSFVTPAPTYEQTWKSVDPELSLHQSTLPDLWLDSSEEHTKRRRPVRKRKRRPMYEPSEEDKRYNAESSEVQQYIAGNSDERRFFREEHRSHETDEPIRYRDTDYPEHTTEMQRRRRLKPEHRRNRWTDEYLEIERPARRGLRRKRPSIDNQPRLTEFDDHREIVYPDRKETDFTPIENTDPNINKENIDDKTTYYQLEKHYLDRLNNAKKPDASVKPDLIETTTQPIVNDYLMTVRKQIPQTEEFSEFSDELIGQSDVTRPVIYENAGRERAPAEPPKVENLIPEDTGNRPIDPTTLKAILKRSNGTSLSEILQQQNLSLSDLLYGKEEALSLIKSKGLMDNDQNNLKFHKSSEESKEGTVRIKMENREEKQALEEVEPELRSHTESDIPSAEENTTKTNDLESQSTGSQTTIGTEKMKQSTDSPAKITTKRRFQNVRRKLRMRPVINNNYKGQLNRDLIAITARRYQNSRNVSKSKEWKYIIPLMNNTDHSEESINKEDTSANKQGAEPLTSTTTNSPEETTIVQDSEYYNPSTIMIETQTEVTIKIDSEDDVEKDETTQAPTTTTQEPTTVELSTTTIKPKPSRLRPNANRMGLRRQAFNNRLKRKRQKQKSTTEPPVGQGDVGSDLFGMPNLVSSSEFIARTQTPQSTKSNDDDDDFTHLDDFITTERSKHLESGPRFTRNSTISDVDDEQPRTTIRFPSTTEETAKFEIEEILNDTRTSARLSRILMERNMTLNELVEHRERGSSHVHLADIFHNASKEPNPPEPFLSKSSIEPISKETYPLRAIIEANLHDPKATTIELNGGQAHYINIPVVMDFGNNVNENGENMGIMSLFNKFTDNDISSVENTEVGKDSEGTPYITTVIAVNNTVNETAREGRVLKDQQNNLKHDVLGWNELFELMRKSHENETDIIPLDDSPTDMKVVLPDADGDGVIVLEDLEHLKNVDNVIGPTLEDNINPSYEREEIVPPGIIDKAPSNSRSVTVATASIVGLAMVLFLLTYAAFKWRQQRNALREKQSFRDDRIPTPVFESRKGHKNNCSTRSISPMLATSNIYTMSTLDSATGKESPEYMWDSLRKPFQ